MGGWCRLWSCEEGEEGLCYEHWLEETGICYIAELLGGERCEGCGGVGERWNYKEGCECEHVFASAGEC